MTKIGALFQSREQSPLDIYLLTIAYTYISLNYQRVESINKDKHNVLHLPILKLGRHGKIIPSFISFLVVINTLLDYLFMEQMTMPRLSSIYGTP